jgi:hypothetical protein
VYLGYFELGGVEIGNAERAQRYVDNLSLGKLQLKEDFISGLHLALEEAEYASPLVDEAPWVDVNDASTHGFLGIVPLTMTGIGDSTREVPTTESILAGGTNGAGRDASRELRYTAMLLGRDELSLEAGLAWLRAAVRGSECSMHTIGCDGSDLRYFLDKPVVCDPLFGDVVEFQSTEGFDTGAVDASTPVVLRFGPEIEPEMPGRGRWDYAATDGTVVRWGGLQLGSGLRLFEEGPLLLQRTNLFPNPTFATSTTGLVAVSGAPTIQRVATGGVDDGSYVAASTPGQFSTRVNWAADSGFLGQDPYQRWQTSGGLELQAAGNSGFPVPNTKHARFISPGDGFYVDGTILGPGVDAGEDATLSVYLAAPQAGNVVVSILNNFGMEVESAVWAVGTAFQRFSLQTYLGANYRIRFATGATALRVGGMLVEAGHGALGSYFDGSAAFSSGETVRASFTDGTPYGTSRLVSGTATGYVIETAPVTGAYGSMVASFALRGPAAPRVQVEMVSLDDSTVLAASSFDPTDVWDRYALMTEFGRRVKLRFSSSRPFDLDQLLIENAEEVYDYLDGTTIPSEENDPPNLLPAQYQTRYVVRWLGTPNNSASRLEWKGGIFVEHEDSDFRPFLEVDHGRLTSSALSIGLSERTTVREQLDPYERRYHDVDAVAGPKVIKRFDLASMKAMSVEIILNAAKPFAFSLPRDVPLPASSWSGVAAFFAADADIVTNHYLNPISTGAYFGTAIQGTASVADATQTVTTQTDLNLLVPGVANVGTRFRRHAFATNYTATTPAGVRWADISYSAGVGVVFGGYFRASKDMTVTILVSARNNTSTGPLVSKTVALKKGRWTRVASDVYPDATSSYNLLTAIVRATGLKAGDVLDYTAMMLVGTTNPAQPFFFGGTPVSKDYSYAWASTAGSSISRRTVVPQISQAFLLDPNLPVIPSPPRPPAVAPTIPAGQLWQRYYSAIPASDVALWADSIPVLELIGNRTQPLRNVRVRFYPNPFGYPAEQIDVNSYCGEFMISYLPKDTRMVVDGISRGAMVQVGAAEPMVADQLVLSSKGGPVAWPEMSCAIPYVMTVDYPGASTARLADVSLSVSRRE